MFHKLAVCTAVIVAVLSDETLALPQGSSLPPTTTGGSPGASYMPKGTKGTSLSTAPSTLNPVKEKSSSHLSDCEPHFPPEKKPEEKGTEDAKVSTIPAGPPVETLAKPQPTPEDKPKGPQPHTVENPVKPQPPLEETPKGPKPPPVAPVSSTPEGPAAKTGAAMEKEEEQKTKGEETEHVAQYVETQSSDESKSSTFSGSIGLMLAGVVAAVAVVGLAVSQVKKARETDAALATPGDHENIHIEIRRTPDGGSTIL